MKVKAIIICIISSLIFCSCNSKFDVFDDRIDKVENRLEELEKWCDKLNNDLIAIQLIVEALQQDAYVRSVSPIMKDGVEIGITITISNGEVVIMYFGRHESSPSIGAAPSDDGKYYWTLDGEFIKDDTGSRIPTIGGDGVAPKLKISESFWYFSYDNGNTWVRLSEVTDEENNYFISVTQDDSILSITLNDGTTINLPIIDQIPLPEIKTLCFKSAENPKVLMSDAWGEISEDAIISVRIPHIVDSKKLRADIQYVGNSVTIADTIPYTSELIIDYSKPVKVTVGNEIGEKKDYIINVHSFTGLPVMYINVNDNKEITSKKSYLAATIKLVEDINTKGPGDVFEANLKIRGRGNTTWGRPKKPYKLKFYDKVSLFGEPYDKEWVLLANYMDKTAIRNELSFYMGRELSNLPYTCRTHYVELFLNNQYVGTYQLGEQQKISEGRVNVTNEGFLVEIDSKAEADDITFTIPTIPQPINIKDPEVEVGSAQYNSIVAVLTKASESLFSETWLDPELGYKNYIDIDSFIDWFLINEIGKNQDAVFFTSCFMNYKPGGKLCMGPLWDFDLAYGNANYGTDTPNPIGWYIKTNVNWYARMFNDPEFVRKAKERFEHYYSNLDNMLLEINSCVDYLKYSVIENNNKWGTLYTFSNPNVVVLGAYENEVHYLKSWLISRMEWMKKEFDQM